ncbi:MAG: hypothetical protein KGL39_20365 [Patescibacteria group bacterium]|nr:hypothetical protein [Patescibacteria group bacterium]
MTTRGLKPSDIPILRAMAEQSGFPYPELSAKRMESVWVIADENDQPVMAAAAERLVQMYLWCGEFERPHAKVHALRLLHEALSRELKGKGYDSAEAFLPPSIAARFARRLEKSFGWVRNWPSWTHRI